MKQRHAFSWLFFLTLGGCASYSDSFMTIERALATRQYDVALQSIERQSNQESQRVLYLLNKGMILRMKRDFTSSNVVLEAAKQEMNRLYATSIRENALSFVINDSTVSYTGDEYEQVLLHFYMALNFLELGKPDAARVEALQVDVKLRELNENISSFQSDEHALLRYLTAMIYEDGSEWSDAMIAYRKAYEEYKKTTATAVPNLLKQDLLRLTQRLGLRDEEEKYRTEFGITPEKIPSIPPQEPPKKSAHESKEHEQLAISRNGELVFFLHNGLAPIKREKAVSLPDVSSGKIVRIALPYYQARLNLVHAARISVVEQQPMPNILLPNLNNSDLTNPGLIKPGLVKPNTSTTNTKTTEQMENVAAVAEHTLNARMPAITARTLARAVAKVQLQKAVTKPSNKDNDAVVKLIGGVAMQIASIATERADTRSWLTLPSNIQLARLPLSPGSYRVKIELLAAGGQVVDTREYADIVVTPARKTYLTEHWVAVQPAIVPTTISPPVTLVPLSQSSRQESAASPASATPAPTELIAAQSTSALSSNTNQAIGRK